ncbi:hypothetical protein J4212_08625 [Candidatus Woesearchaeota archaeon]|nr:hypothetical protein [Candidatus Woesearchaeota archaeon]
MAELVDLADKIKRYFQFSFAETRGLILATAVFAFILSFREWGTTSFDAIAGMFNYFNAFLIVGLSILVHTSAQRVWALVTGYKHEFQLWGIGLAFALIATFVTRGIAWWFVIPGGFMVHMMAGHRLGWFRYDINYWALGLIAFAGPLGNIVLAALFKSLGGFFASALIKKAVIFNVAYAICSVLPIPPLDGSKMFFGSRMFYAFGLSGIVAAGILLLSDLPVWLSVISAFLIAVILWLLYYVYLEEGKDWWPYG